MVNSNAFHHLINNQYELFILKYFEFPKISISKPLLITAHHCSVGFPKMSISKPLLVLHILVQFNSVIECSISELGNIKYDLTIYLFSLLF